MMLVFPSDARRTLSNQEVQCDLSSSHKHCSCLTSRSPEPLRRRLQKFEVGPRLVNSFSGGEFEWIWCLNTFEIFWTCFNTLILWTVQYEVSMILSRVQHLWRSESDEMSLATHLSFQFCSLEELCDYLVFLCSSRSRALLMFSNYTTFRTCITF